MSRLFFTILFLLVCPFVVGSASFAAQMESPVVSFKDWKSEKIQLAQKKIINFDEQKNKDGLMSPTEAQSHAQQLKWNLEIAQDLSVTDYTILYLSQIKKSKPVFRQAAEKLTPSDVADLLEAYTKAIEMGRSISPKMILPKQATSEN